MTGYEGSRLGAVGLLLGLIGLAVLGYALIFMNMPPEFPLAAIGGAAALIALVARPILSVHLFIAVVYAENLVRNDSNMTIMKGVGILIVFGWLLNVFTRRRVDLRLSPVLIFMSAFVGWAAISMLSAYDTSLAMERVLTFTQLAVFVVVFAS